MDETTWFRWLAATTGESTERGIARKVGRSHTTIQRWIRNGVPHSTVWELVLRFHGDPVAACVVLGYVGPDDVSKFNYAEVVKYAPIDVLTGELHDRALRRRSGRTELRLERRRVSFCDVVRTTFRG